MSGLGTRVLCFRGFRHRGDLVSRLMLRIIWATIWSISWVLPPLFNSWIIVII